MDRKHIEIKKKKHIVKSCDLGVMNAGGHP